MKLHIFLLISQKNSVYTTLPATTAIIDAGLNLISSLAAACNVAPVVNKSSTNTMCLLLYKL